MNLNIHSIGTDLTYRSFPLCHFPHGDCIPDTRERIVLMQLIWGPDRDIVFRLSRNPQDGATGSRFTNETVLYFEPVVRKLFVIIQCPEFIIEVVVPIIPNA